ncbi:MAG: YcxB family protein [Clostridia bacterium]|nr:YcxB family protein [Clostridia bacterium]
MVEFEGKFDESVTKSLNNRTFKKLWWVFVLFSAVFILLGVCGILFREDGEDLSYGIFLIAVGVLFTPAVFLLTKILQKRVDKSMSVMSSDTTQTFQFYPDKLVISQVKQRYGEEECEYQATTIARYSYLYGAEETRDTYFLRISKMQYHVVNKCDLKQGTIEELNSILSSNLGQRFKRTVK